MAVVGRQVAVDTTAGGTLLATDDINRNSDHPLTVLVQFTSTTVYIGGQGTVDSTHGIVANSTIYPGGLSFTLWGGEDLYALSSSGSVTLTLLELNK